MPIDVQTSQTETNPQEEKQFLYELDERLRVAIATALTTGQVQLGVALDDARNFLESVLMEQAPSAARLFIARARAEMALGVYRRICPDDESAAP